MRFEPIFNSCKIKYPILYNLINSNFKYGTHVNVYLNLDSIFEKLYIPDIASELASDRHMKNVGISSEIMNIVAHYRRFFWKSYKVKTTFYLYFLNKIPVFNSSMNKEYLKGKMLLKSPKNHIYGSLNNTILENMSWIYNLSVYTPGCYCVPTNGIEPSLVPYYIINECDDKDVNHLIISTDKNDYQNLTINNKRTYLLRLKYDDSYIVTKDSIYDHKFKNIKYRPSVNVSPELYSLTLAFNGLRSRDVSTIKGYGFATIMKKLNSAITENRIPNKYINDMLMVSQEITGDYANFKTLDKNFKAIDLKTGYTMLYDYQKDEINNRIKDRYDVQGLIKLNETLYDNNPINLSFLWEGVL